MMLQQGMVFIDVVVVTVVVLVIEDPAAPTPGCGVLTCVTEVPEDPNEEERDCNDAEVTEESELGPEPGIQAPLIRLYPGSQLLHIPLTTSPEAQCAVSAVQTPFLMKQRSLQKIHSPSGLAMLQLGSAEKVWITKRVMKKKLVSFRLIWPLSIYKNHSRIVFIQKMLLNDRYYFNIKVSVMEKKHKENEVMDGVLTYLLTLASTENVLQSIKEVLTLHQSFNPFTLFNYISQNATVISKQHIIDFLGENGLTVTEELVKVFLVSNGFKEKLSYSEFLNYVYPVSSQVLRQISTNQIKKYSKTEKIQVNEEVLCCFLMLLDQQIEFIKTFEDLKREQPVNASRDKLKKVFRTIKKASEKESKSIGQLSAENVITHGQLRSFIKLYHKVQDHQMLNLGRRLSMGKEGIIGLEEFQFWLKPWKKQKAGEEDNVNNNRNSRSVSQKKELNPRSEKKHSFVHDYYHDEQVSQEDNFVSYISKFLEAEKQTQESKTLLITKPDFDIMALFKTIDKKSCGVICKQDIEEIFLATTAEKILNVDLLINKYSSGRGVLSLSEFSQIYKCHAQQSKLSTRKTSFRPISVSTIKIALSIIKANIESEEKLQIILRKFSKPQIKQLFEKINEDGNGYISYQELKGYLANNGMQLPMSDLMSILKRFDKNKNGVIVEDDFVRVLAV